MHTFSQPSYFTTGSHRIFLEYTPCLLEHPGPLIVLLHGLGGSTNSLQPLVSDLSISHPLLRLDWRGHGRSPLNPNLEFEDLVLLLREIIVHASPHDPVILVGHSLGSTVALHYAARWPDGVKALTVIGPHGKRKPESAEQLRSLAAAARRGVEYLMDATVENNVSPHSSEVVRAFVREAVAGQNPEGYAIMCEMMAGLAAAEAHEGKGHDAGAGAGAGHHHYQQQHSSSLPYDQIVCPTVVVAGLDDRISSFEMGREVARLIEQDSSGGGGDERKKGMKVGVVVVNSGHQHVLEDPQGVLDAIRGLLGRVR